jgi:hypothetical protein
MNADAPMPWRRLMVTMDSWGQERRNKLVLQIGDAGLLVWLSFALATIGPVPDVSRRLRPAMSPPRE